MTENQNELNFNDALESKLQQLFGAYPKEDRNFKSNIEFFKALHTKIEYQINDNKINEGKKTILAKNIQYLLRSTLAYYVEKSDLNNNLYIFNYDTQKYEIDKDSMVFKQALRLILDRSPRDAEVKAELNALRVLDDNNLQPMIPDFNWLATQNCIININTKEIKQYSIDIFVKSYINTTYNPNIEKIPTLNGQTPLDIIKTLADNNENRFKGFLQIIRQALLKHNLEQSIICLVGDGGRGKSSFIYIIKQLVGENMIISATIDQLEKDDKIEILAKSHVLLGDDIDDGIYLDKLSNLKSLSGGGSISISRKYESSIDVSYPGVLIQAMPKIAKMNDRAGQMSRRIKPYALKHKFSNDENKIDINDLMEFFAREDVKSYLLNAILDENITPNSNKWIGWDEELLYEATMQNDIYASFFEYIENETFLLQAEQIPVELLRTLFLDLNETPYSSNLAIKSRSFITDIKNKMLELGYVYDHKSTIRPKKYIKYLAIKYDNENESVRTLQEALNLLQNEEESKKIMNLFQIESQVGKWTYHCCENNKPCKFFVKI